MPYKSKAQAAYFHIHKKELEKKGVDVDEWDKASKGKKLPKKAKKKYQFAGSTNPCGPGTQWDANSMQCVPIPTNPNVDPVFQNDYSGDFINFNPSAYSLGNGKVVSGNVVPINNPNAGAIDARGNFVPYQQIVPDAIDKGFNYDSDNVYRKAVEKTNNNILGYSDPFKVLNIGLNLTQGIAGVVNDAKTKKQEKYNLLKARYNRAYYNPYEQGLNNVPVYQAGGKPIVTYDKNDPRLKEYNDSLNLYNKSIQNRNDELASFPKLGFIPHKASLKEINEANKNLGRTLTPLGNKQEWWVTTSGGLKGVWKVSKKPNTPVIYSPIPPIAKMDDVQEQTAPNSTQPILNIPQLSRKETNYRFNYPNASGKMQTIYFNTLQEYNNALKQFGNPIGTNNYLGSQQRGDIYDTLLKGDPTMQNGGSIYIDPKHKGLFTKEAKAAGMSVQEFASHVLANKDHYSPAVVKRANFAKNFAYQNGGSLPSYLYKNKNGELNVDIDKLPNTNKFDDTRQWMQNWINNRPKQFANFAESQYRSDHPFLQLFGVNENDKKETIASMKNIAINNLKNVDVKDGSVIPGDAYVPLVEGEYSRFSHNIFFPTGIADKDLAAHEFGHASGLARISSINDYIHNTIKNDSKYKSNYDGYYSSPEEIYSRIWALRKKYNLQPNQTVTPQFLQQKYNEDQKSFFEPDEIYNHLNIDTITNLLNGLVTNNKSNTNTTAQNGGYINNTGYLPQFKTSQNPYNIIPSNDITMNGVPQDLLAIPNVGKPQVMPANSGKYKFPNATHVTEIPLAKNGGSFSIGSHVGWNSEAGHVTGTITKKHTKPFKVNGYTKHASKDNPVYEIKSSKTDHVAYHFAGALHTVKEKHQTGGSSNLTPEELMKFSNFANSTDMNTINKALSNYGLKNSGALFEPVVFNDQLGNDIRSTRQDWLGTEAMRAISNARKLNIPPAAFKANKEVIFNRDGRYGDVVLNDQDFARLYPNYIDVVNKIYTDQYNKYPANSPEPVAQAYPSSASNFQYGGLEEVNSQPNGNAEVEEGEVIQQNSGDIVKAAEGSGTHEEGGNVQPDVSRVLEDTADKRKDKDSKLLRITPNEALEITGFKPKNTVTHSKLFEQATDFYSKKLRKFEKKINDNLAYIKNNGGQYAGNSLQQNLKLLSTFPTEAELFDKIYNHQEAVKNINGIMDNPDKKVGGFVPKFQNGSSKANAIKLDDPKGWEFVGQEGNKKYYRKKGTSEVKTFTDYDVVDTTHKGSFTVDDILNHPERFSTFANNMEGAPDDVKRKAAEDLFYHGIMPRQYTKTLTTPDQYGYMDLPSQPGVNNRPQVGTRYNTPGGSNASEFNMPLHWYDVAGNVANYLSSSERIPVSFEQLNREPLRVHELNPQPALDANTGDFNAAIAELPNNGVGFANQANLLANKYKINNEIVGQYANQNAVRADQIDAANNANKFQLDQINLNLRDRAVNQQLQGMEVERQSKLNAFDDYLTKLAQNAAFNRNGNLILQLTPYFDQNGKFNGNQYIFRDNGNGNAQILDKKTGKVVKTITQDGFGDTKQIKTYIRE